MKVTFVSYIYPYPERGYNPGIERVIQEFARELTNKGHEVHVITTYRNGGTAKEEQDEDVRLHRVPDARHYLGKVGSAFSIDLLSLNYSTRRYRHLLEESDIVHTFTPIVSKNFSTPLVAHYHHWDEPSEPMEYLYLPTSQRLWLRCYDLADTVIAVSQYSADDLASRGVDREKIEVVHNGVDTNTYRPGPSSITFDEWESVLLYVGPLVERKGINHLIKAMPEVVSEHSNTGLVIVGGGNQDEYIQLAKEFGVRDRISFEGFVTESQLPEYYRAADVFVFPSTLEGFGMVLVEAMACGLPVISTTATAIPEVVGDAGKLVPPQDNHSLSKNISELLGSGELDQWSQRSCQRVQRKFRWSQTSRYLVACYENIVGQLENSQSSSLTKEDV